MKANALIASAAALAFVALGALGSAPAQAGPAYDLPPVNVKWDYQIGRAYSPSNNVELVSRDREADPAPGLYNICYVNAYQTQPHETRWWKNNHRNLLLRKANGGYVVDSYWGEVLLDISTPAKRRAIARIVGRWINGCERHGFDAVEPDNLDSWTRSGGRLDKDDAFALARLISERAHSVGLAIAQKNAAGQVDRGVDASFDFAVAEECGRYRECGAYRAGYGDNVLVIEYRSQDFTYSCNRWGDQLSIVLRDRGVKGPSSDKYVYDWC
jgi:hypothetical protein